MNDEDNVWKFFERCVRDLNRMPLEVNIPQCLTDEHEKLAKRYSSFKRSEYGPCFEELTTSQANLILPLYKQVFYISRHTIRQQASRSISHLISYQIEKHYPNFFIAVDNREELPKKTIHKNEVISSNYAYLNLPKGIGDDFDCFPSSRLPRVPARLTLFGDI